MTFTAPAARKHPPDPPVDAVVKNKTDSYISIQWSPPDSDRPVPIKGYIVERRKVGAQTWQRCNAGETIASTEITVCSFTEEASYQFRISAMNDFGQSPYLEVPGSFYLGKNLICAAFVIHGQMQRQVWFIAPGCPQNPLQKSGKAWWIARPSVVRSSLSRSSSPLFVRASGPLMAASCAVEVTTSLPDQRTHTRCSSVWWPRIWTQPRSSLWVEVHKAVASYLWRVCIHP